MVDLDIGRGVVVSYDRRRNRRRGYLCVLGDLDIRTGEVLFFRLKNGCIVVRRNGVRSLVPPIRQNQRFLIADPRVGEVVVFTRAQGYKGHRVEKWTFAKCWYDQVHVALRPA
ncbi:MAG: hypothetical protein ABSB12_00840 [Candidatus Saccharimonadales bacterium]|jgi:hypothetical protein